jgi:hypothetical protein
MSVVACPYESSVVRRPRQPRERLKTDSWVRRVVCQHTEG